MSKSKRHAKRRVKLQKRGEWHQRLERKRLNEQVAKEAQAKEPRESYRIDDVS